VQSALAGAALAVVVVYAYYNDPWRPLAHVLGPWIVLAAAVSFGRPARLAIGTAVASLAAAVVAFYVGLKVGHDLRWGDSGSVMFVDWNGVTLWLILAVPAGVVVGLLASFAARSDRTGAAAAAALLGLVLGDALRRYINWGGVDVAVLVDLLAAAVMFTVAVRRNGRPALTFAWTVVAAVVGYLLVSVPDFIEQILFEGF
jgi:hypothetical protein